MNAANLNSTINHQNHPTSQESLFSEIRIYELMLAIVVFFVIRSLAEGRRLGITPWPVVGMLPSLISALHGNLYEWLTAVLHRQNGTFRFDGPWFSDLRCVVTANPRNIEHILKTNFSNYPKGDHFRNTVHDLLGDGIFAADKDTWQKQRAIAGTLFSGGVFRRNSADSLTELVHKRLLPILENSSTQSSFIDLQDLLLRLTFDNICIMAFGVDPGCLREGLPQIGFARAFEEATETTFLRFFVPTAIWKTMKYLRIGRERSLTDAVDEVHRFAEKVIRRRRRIGEVEKEEVCDLLTVFLQNRDDGKVFSEKFVRDMCVNFILAGRDTSSVALTWFFWLIDQHGEVEDRILREITEIMKERRVIAGAHAELQPEEVNKMGYLHAALSEAMRLYPSVPVDNKEALHDDVLPDGTSVRRGMKVIYAIYAMGRMEGIWGEDCRDFKPERWLRRRDGRWEFQPAPTYKFAAFNGGPRLCLGKEFAYFQMKFVAASLLYRFKIAVANNHPVQPKLALTMYMKHGLQVRVCRRDEFDMHESIHRSDPFPK